MTKTIDTLIPDMEEVILGLGGWDKAVTHYLSESISQIAEERFSNEEHDRTHLSLSQVGTPSRKLWYQLNRPDLGEPLSYQDLGTFFLGDIIEAFAIAVAMAAGHKVEGAQDVLTVNGVPGHRDCVIDGMTVDVKSASKFGFKKFKEHNLRNEDPFGYISQLSSYVYAGKDDPKVTDKNRGAFLAVRKDRFELCLDIYDFTKEMKRKDREIKQAKKLKDSEVVPMRCFPDIPDGKSGNRKLGMQCGYCQFKHACWPGLRTFLYAGPDGPVPRYLTQVVKEPKVKEVT